MKYENLTIIGTSHIAKQSVDQVKAFILEEKPGIIGIELDKKRYRALTSNQKTRIRMCDILKIGIKGYLFSIIGAYVEKKLGKMVGVSPGSEMINAIKLAKENKIKIALIDQDIEITLKRFSKALTWKEKWNFVVDIFKSIFMRKEELKRLGIEKFDLTKVPSKKIVKKLIKEVKLRYPNIYKVLIKERNYYMARKISALMKKYPNQSILAVVGAGHEDEIIEIVKKIFSYKIEYSFSVET